MRLVLQRVRQASVSVDAETVAAIGPGLLVLVGFGRNDGPNFAHSKAWSGMLGKMLNLRIFPGLTPEKADKFDTDVLDFGGEVLLVSQFTLYADCRSGRRPGFQEAAQPPHAAALFSQFVADIDARIAHRVRSGIFGAHMDVALVNWGPVTIVLDSDELFPSPAEKFA